METGSAGADPRPVSLVDCGIEELLTALLAGQPVALLADGEPFFLTNDDTRRVLSYYARHRDLWPRAKPVQAPEIEDILKALAEEVPAPEMNGATTTPRRLWKLKRTGLPGCTGIAARRAKTPRISRSTSSAT